MRNLKKVLVLEVELEAEKNKNASTRVDIENQNCCLKTVVLHSRRNYYYSDV